MILGVYKDRGSMERVKEQGGVFSAIQGKILKITKISLSVL